MITFGNTVYIIVLYIIVFGNGMVVWGGGGIIHVHVSVSAYQNNYKQPKEIILPVDIFISTCIFCPKTLIDKEYY